MQSKTHVVLPNLRNARENPPSVDVTVSSEVLNSSDSQNNLFPDTMDEMNNVTAIDWDITLDSSKIDWDIGTLEETEENGNGLGPYEIVNASDVSSNSPGLELPHETLQSKEDPFVQDVTASDISWDISVESAHVGESNDAGLSSVVKESHSDVKSASSNNEGDSCERSPLLDTEYRNKILDDLFEVCRRIFC